MIESSPIKRLSFVAALVVAATISQADYYYFTGLNSTYLSDGNNWSSGGSITGFLPSNNDDVFFNSYFMATPRADGDTGLYVNSMHLSDIEFAGGGNTFGVVSNFEINNSNIHDVNLNGQIATFDVGSFGNTNQLSNSYLDVSTGSLNFYNGSQNYFTGVSSYSDSLYLDLTNTSTLLNLSSSYVRTNYATFSGTVNLDSTSTFTADNGYTDIYNESLVMVNGTLSNHGQLFTNGASIGNTFFGTSANSTVNILGADGNWTDTSGSVVSIGFGGSGVLNVDEGGVSFGGELRVGEGNYYYDSNGNVVSLVGNGSVNVSNSGNLYAKQITLGGYARYGSASGETYGSGVGSLNISSGGLVVSDGVYGLDWNNTGQSAASVSIDNAILRTRNLSIQSSAGGASSISVNNQGELGADSLYLRGDSSNEATLVVDNSYLHGTSFQITNNARALIYDGSTVDVTQMLVGPFYGSSEQAASLQVLNSTINLKPDTSSGTSYISVGAGSSLQISHSYIDTHQSQGNYFTLWSNTNGNIEISNTDLIGHGSFSSANGSTTTFSNGTFRFADNTTDVNVVNFGTDTVAAVNAARVNLTNAQLQAWVVRFGSSSTDMVNAQLHDSSVTALRDIATTTTPGQILIGNGGQTMLEMWNSSLNAKTIYIGSNSTLKGDGSLNGVSFGSGSAVPTSVINNGTISPGHSPGHLTINGDLINNGVLYMEIDLNNPTSYDSITITGQFTMGGTLKLVGLGSGTFDPAKHYNLFTAGSFLGSFAHYELDPRLGLTANSFSFNGGNFGVNPVPEPTSIAVLGLGLVAILKRRKKS